MKNFENVKAQETAVSARSFKLQLSDSDVRMLFEKAGGVGLTPDELLSNFVYDLICGTYTNGSNERMYTNEWFDRCGFSYGTEKTFLSYLLKNDILGYFFELRKNIADYQNDISDMELSDYDSKEEYDEEMKYINKCISDADEELQEMFEDYCSYNFDHKSFEEELKIIGEYQESLEAALNEK